MKRFNMVAVITAVTVIMALCACASSGGSGGGGGRAGEGGKWTFENPDHETGGWYLAKAEFYQYHGAATLSRDDSTMGKPMLRMDVDFSNDIDVEWSEVKIANDFPKSINMKGIDKFAFDFYYNPSLRSDGVFKPKIWSNNGSKFIDETGIDLEKGPNVSWEEVEGGWIKVRCEIYISPGPGFIPDMRLGIAGYLTDYVGPVFFDNIAWMEK